MNMDDYIGVRLKDRILTLYSISFHFASHADTVNIGDELVLFKGLILTLFRDVFFCLFVSDYIQK